MESSPPSNARSITISERRVTEIVENGILRLQLALAETFAHKRDVERVKDDLRLVAVAAEQRMEVISAQIEGLEKDKAGRDAVIQYKNLLTGGAVLLTVFSFIQVALTIYLISRGHAYLP